MAVIIPNTIKNKGENGSHLYAIDRRMRATKLNGGPGIMGRIHPTIPAKIRINPTIIKTIMKKIPFQNSAIQVN